MKALIYIEVLKELELTWSSTKFDSIKNTYHDHELFDIDNFSDAKSIDIASKIIAEFNTISIIINCCSEEAKLNKILSLFNIIKSNKSKIQLTLTGVSHPHLETLRKQLSL